MDRSHDAARRWFAEDLRVAAPVLNNEAVLEAFARVPRERFCGDGPWQIHPRRLSASPYLAETSTPEALYHDVLVAIDKERDLNNGQPSLWAFVFDQLDLAVDQCILQIGAGTGYYTAILADIVGPGGRVEAIELDPALARRAQTNLQAWPWADVRHGNGVDVSGGTPADAIIVFAGATHPPRNWLNRLRTGGKMLLPLTAADGWGFLLHLEKTEAGIAATSLGRCGFFPCDGARLPEEERRLAEALSSTTQGELPIRALHLGRAESGLEGVWLQGDDYWLSTAPLVVH